MSNSIPADRTTAPATTTGTTATSTPDTSPSHSYESSKPPWKETALGDDRSGHPRNISWGSVIAGVGA